MKEVVTKSRIKQLEELLNVLAEAIDSKPGARDLAQLSKQYRETLDEIEQIKGEKEEDDDIAEILFKRSVNGKPRAVR